MLETFMRYGGVEVINTERLMAYVENGLVPAGTKVAACGTCQGLAETLSIAETGSFEGYRSPILDKPPWYDPDNPDTWDFAGVLPLGVTGLDGTTAVIDTAQTLDGFALPSARRREARTISVSALLVGRTSESVQAGLAWLTTVLHRQCSPTVGCGPSADLEAFTICPGEWCRTADIDAGMSPYALSPMSEGYDTWEVFGTGTFGPALEGGFPQVCAAELGPIIAGTATHPSPLGIYGGPPAPGSEDYYDVEPVYGGGPSAVHSVGDYTIVAPEHVFSDMAGTVLVEWTLERSDAAPAPVMRMVLLDPAGQVLWWGPETTYSSGTDPTWAWDDGINYGNGWRPGLAIAEGCADFSGVTVTSYPQVSAGDCLAPYARVFPAAATVAGPVPVGVVSNGDCADWLHVEWTWVPRSPYRYGRPQPLLTDASTNPSIEPGFAAAGVSLTRQASTPAGLWNCPAPLDPAACFADPCTPGFAAPPLPPVVVDPNAPVITTQHVANMGICLDPAVVPNTDAVMTVTLTNDGLDKVGTRVRVYDNVQPGCVPEDLCDFAYEYLIGYIPPGGVLTIDGATGTITTVCDGIMQDSSSVVRGSYGGPTQDPVLACDRRTYVSVQHLKAYPKTCTGYYTAGDDQGYLSVSLSVSAREG